MANKTTPRQSSDQDDAPRRSETGADEERRYATHELVEAARVRLGVSPHVAAGALSTSDRKTHTLGQAEQLVAEFTAREGVL